MTDAHVEQLTAELAASNHTITLLESQLFMLSRVQDHPQWTQGGIMMIGDRGWFDPAGPVEDQVASIDGPSATVTTVTGVTYRYADCVELTSRDRLPRPEPRADGG